MLAPEGAMHLMVYAPYGRAGVYLLQDYCRRLGIGTTASEIRESRPACEGRRGSSIVAAVAQSPDFRRTPAWRRAAAPAGPLVFGAAVA